jgi:uncharacterized protein DUF4160
MRYLLGSGTQFPDLEICYDIKPKRLGYGRLKMPTVLKFEGLRVVVYPNDHRPAHVHVIGPDAEALFFLSCPTGAIRLRENYGFPLSRLNRIEKVLKKNQEALCRAWENIHGNS